MKLVIGVSSSPDNPGGISTYAKELAACMARLGHEVHYISPAPKTNEWFRQHNIKFLPVSEVDDQVAQCRTTLKYIRDLAPALVINNDNSILQSIAPAIACPFIPVCHLDSRAIAAMACANSNFCDYVVAISYDMHDRLISRYGVPSIKVPIVFNGIETRRDGPAEKRSAGGPIKCVFSGNSTRRKGADLFVQLMEKTRHLENLEFYWFGNVPEPLQQKLSSYPNLKHIGRVNRETYLGSIKDADVLIFPSREEGCPMAILEAMEYGLIPIASNGTGAMRNMITHGHDGYVCHLNTWAKEATHILAHIVKSPELAKRLANEAIRTRRSRFTIESTATSLLKLSESPTVDRSKCTVNSVGIYRWHRPGISQTNYKPTIYERICFRFGILSKVGTLAIH